MLVSQQVVYDKSIKEKLGDEAAVIAYWNAAAPHTQAIFCHASLGTQIKFERIGNFEYLDTKIEADSSYLRQLKPHADKVIGSADLVVYIAYGRMTKDGKIGVAWRPSICSSSNLLKTSINEWLSSSVAFGGVILFFLYR